MKIPRDLSGRGQTLELQRVPVRDHSALRIGTQRPLWVDRRKRNAAPRRRCGDGRP